MVGMAVAMGTPDVGELGGVLEVLREWQWDGAPLQLHPGDVGWLWRLGAHATATALRTWSRDGRILAVGMLDGADLVRLAILPEARQDEELARRLVSDVADPDRGVLPGGQAHVEVPPGALVHDVLGEAGWVLDEPWALLRRDLTAPVEDAGLRIEEVGPDLAPAWVTVHRSAFGADHLAVDLLVSRWRAMADGLPYTDARCLLAYDAEDNAVAAVIVWGAGPGRYGLIEPLGAHRDHHGHGHGRAITLAGAAALREMGAAAAIVITRIGNVAGVGAYRAGGFELLAERRDRRRVAV